MSPEFSLNLQVKYLSACPIEGCGAFRSPFEIRKRCSPEGARKATARCVCPCRKPRKSDYSGEVVRSSKRSWALPHTFACLGQPFRRRKRPSKPWRNSGTPNSESGLGMCRQCPRGLVYRPVAIPARSTRTQGGRVPNRVSQHTLALERILG